MHINTNSRPLFVWQAHFFKFPQFQSIIEKTAMKKKLLTFLMTFFVWKNYWVSPWHTWWVNATHDKKYFSFLSFFSIFWLKNQRKVISSATQGLLIKHAIWSHFCSYNDSTIIRVGLGTINNRFRLSSGQKEINK